jgi:hypothetical protein
MSGHLTKDDAETIVAVVAGSIKPFADKLAEVTREVQTLREAHQQRAVEDEQRLRAIEEKSYMRYCDVWREGTEYTVGDTVTHQGSAWVCRRPTVGRPNEDFVGWQLIVKRGAAK